ncbi:DUF1853 family protein [Cupriavidus basilensis]
MAGPAKPCWTGHCFVGPNPVDRLERPARQCRAPPARVACRAGRSAAARSTCSGGCSTGTVWCRLPSAIWESRPTTCMAGGLTLQDWSDWAHKREGSRWYRLPRSAWMAPARVAQAHTETAEAVHEALAQRALPKRTTRRTGGARPR